MKLKQYLFAILFLFIGAACVTYGQQKPATFFIKHVVFEGDYVPRFVWRIANSTIPWDRESNDGDMTCVRNALLDTNLFTQVKTRLHRLDQLDAYDLVISLTYLSENPAYKLARIEVQGFDSVLTSRLKESLMSSNLIGQSISLKTADYAVFEDRILELFKVNAVNGTEYGYTIPFIAPKLNKSQELEITLMPKFEVCKHRSSQKK